MKQVVALFSLSLPLTVMAAPPAVSGESTDMQTEEQLTGDTISEVVVEASRPVSGTQSVQMSAMEVPIDQIMAIPAIGGEVDILKAVQLLPGVHSGAEGSGGLYVRGGGPDENLVMLDGVPLYSVNHMLGFFSVFNADIVKSVTLYEGNFPARYGGRLSSIIDVKQKDGDPLGYHGNLTIGLVSTKLSVEGPVYWHKDEWRKYRRREPVRGQTTFTVSARRTLYDLFMAPLAALITSRRSGGEERTTAGYYFCDINAKLTHTFSDNDKLSGTFYYGDDVAYARIRQDASSDRSENMRMHYNWGNLLAAVRYEHRFDHRMHCNTRVSYTRYKYNLHLTDVADSNRENEHKNMEMVYDSYIMDLTAQTDFEWRPGSRHEVHFGAGYTFHTFRPQVGRVAASEVTDSTSFHRDTTISVGGTDYTHEANVYIEDTYTPCSWFKLNVGLHAGLFHTGRTAYPSVEPRAGMRFLPHRDVAVKLSYAYMTQYVHMLSNSSVSLPTDLWVPVTDKIPPMHSMQVALGVTYNICNQVELSVEGYYKRMINLLEYKDGASYTTTRNWQELVAVGNGWSYGVQVLARRGVGPVTGWIGYTWSRTMRQFDREGQEINFGKPFHAKYDREHDLSITLQYQINRQWNIAATFVYATGTRGTMPLRKYDDMLYSTTVGQSAQARNIYYVSERNNYKMPDYHRLDLGATCRLPDKKHAEWEHILHMAVYNAYCNFNPFLVYPKDNKLYKLSLLPVLPSLSYTFKF
ncbi:MAG: TonB-dependent receptor plug domain-containing protein [Paludibacteraceae bacterium]|nr:TonB-dependent receptor plug domain-containing protein [Paludibacteraceae bacterium]